MRFAFGLLQLLIAIAIAIAQRYLPKMVGCSQGRHLCCPGRNMSCALIQVPADSSFDSFERELDTASGDGSIGNFGYFSVKRTSDVNEEKPSFNRVKLSAHLSGYQEFLSDTSHGSGQNEGRVHEYLIQSEGSGHEPDMSKTFSYTVEKGQPAEMMKSQIAGVPSLCYCDSDCRLLGDCCDDYDYACPIQDCSLTQWTVWTECVRDESMKPRSCSVGVQTRNRFPIHQAKNGGRGCPEMMEQKYCAGVDSTICNNLPTKDEISLILPYNFSQARFDNYKQDQYYDQPAVVSELKTLTNDCFFMELEWISPSCQNDIFNQYLELKSSICAECQRRAKMHNLNRRCTGEGFPDKESLWLDSQNNHCFGYWTRRKMVQGCRCAEHSNPAQSVILV